MPVENEVAAGEGSSDDDSKSRQGFGACDDLSVDSAEDLEDGEEALQNRAYHQFHREAMCLGKPLPVTASRKVPRQVAL